MPSVETIEGGEKFIKFLASPVITMGVISDAVFLFSFRVGGELPLFLPAEQ